MTRLCRVVFEDGSEKDFSKSKGKLLPNGWIMFRELEPIKDRARASVATDVYIPPQAIKTIVVAHEVDPQEKGEWF